MKKITLILIVVLLMAVLIGCGSDSSSKSRDFSTAKLVGYEDGRALEEVFEAYFQYMYEKEGVGDEKGDRWIISSGWKEGWYGEYAPSGRLSYIPEGHLPVMYITNFNTEDNGYESVGRTVLYLRYVEKENTIQVDGMASYGYNDGEEERYILNEEETYELLEELVSNWMDWGY